MPLSAMKHTQGRGRDKEKRGSWQRLYLLWKFEKPLKKEKKNTHDELSCDEISNADVKSYLTDATESRRDVISTDTYK